MRYADGSSELCYDGTQNASFLSGGAGSPVGFAGIEPRSDRASRVSEVSIAAAPVHSRVAADDPLLFDFKPPHPHSLHFAVKRLIDIAGAGFGLLLLLPVFCAVAALIKLTSRGPVFFRQNRTGLGNTTFEILKFRSMYVDLCDDSGVSQTVASDPRVTPIGRMLRRTNLDELPQLVNVLRGDMSLVGPRPHVPGMLAAGKPYEELVRGYERRHMMRPGITGLAQVHGLRGPTTDPEPSVRRIERDLEYIRDFSILLDLKILVRTIVSELRGGSGF